MGSCYTRDSGIFLLADGMGGHPEGEVAAQLALEAMSAAYQQEATPEIADVGVVVDRRAANVHPNRFSVGGGEVFDFLGEGVIEADRHRGLEKPL